MPDRVERKLAEVKASPLRVARVSELREELRMYRRQLRETSLLFRHIEKLEREFQREMVLANREEPESYQ